MSNGDRPSLLCLTAESQCCHGQWLPITSPCSGWAPDQRRGRMERNGRYVYFVQRHLRVQVSVNTLYNFQPNLESRKPSYGKNTHHKNLSDLEFVNPSLSTLFSLELCWIYHITTVRYEYIKILRKLTLDFSQYSKTKCVKNEFKNS